MKHSTTEERFLAKFVISERKEWNGTPCWEWVGGKSKPKNGYGLFKINGQMVKAHRHAYEQHYKVKIPDGIECCHSCDNPGCVNPLHLFLDTHAGNMSDMSRKGRSLAQAHPERMARGEQHWSNTNPEKVARGDRHYSRTNPERVARGDRHYRRTNPELTTRGEQVGTSKLSEDQVRQIRELYASGGISQYKLADMFGVNQATISHIIRRKLWRHI